MFLHFLVDDVLELDKHVSEASIIFIFFAEYLVDDGQEVLDDAVWEQFNAFEM
jgi:hypothetical protein